MLSALSLLAKVSRLRREAIANKPVDPLACLTSDERAFYNEWWRKFKAEHSDDDNPEALYQAWLSFTGWTPADLLPNYPKAKLYGLSLDQIHKKYSDIRDAGKTI